MENSHIEWTDHTFNPWWGCMKVSEGCKNCYAETLDNRYNHTTPHWGPNSLRKPMSAAYWKQPFKWNEAAKQSGVKAKVFCASMADVFEDNSKVTGWRIDLFHTILNTPHLIWQLLTKRPENILKLVSESWLNKWPDNVWIGTSVENQKTADERIPHLLDIPAKVRFLSCEPLLGDVNLSRWFEDWKCENCLGTGIKGFGRDIKRCPFNCHLSWKSGIQIQWVICGGESGFNARPMHPDWVLSLRDQCQAANVPFFFKQWGEWVEFDQLRGEVQRQIKSGERRHHIENFDYGKVVCTLHKTGKKLSGSLLNGKECKEFPPC